MEKYRTIGEKNMISVTMKLAETLERLKLYNKKEWFNLSMRLILNDIEKEMYNELEERNKSPEWDGLLRSVGQIEQAQEEKEGSESRGRVLRIDRNKRSFDWKHD